MTAMSPMGTWKVRNGPTGGRLAGRGLAQLARVDEGCLVDDEAHGGEHPVVVGAGVPRRDLPESQRHLDAAVRRIGLTEHRGGEHAEPLPVRGRVLEHVVFEAEPELFRLVEARRLRGGVRVVEGVGVGPRRDRRLAPHRVAAAHEVPAVEIVAGVDRRAGLPVGGDAVVEPPLVAAAIEVEQRRPVDVDAGGAREAAGGVEHHREVHVVELDRGLANDAGRDIRRFESRHRRSHPQEPRIETHAPTRPRPAHIATVPRTPRRHEWQTESVITTLDLPVPLSAKVAEPHPATGF